MANALYTNGKEALLDGTITWLTTTIRVMLVDLGEYTPDLGTDKFVSDIPSAARVSLSSALTGRTATGGVADASDITVGRVAGDSVGAFVLYADTGSLSSSRLLAYIDTSDDLPFTPNGGDVDINWPSGGIFTL